MKMLQVMTRFINLPNMLKFLFCSIFPRAVEDVAPDPVEEIEEPEPEVPKPEVPKPEEPEPESGNKRKHLEEQEDPESILRESGLCEYLGSFQCGMSREAIKTLLSRVVDAAEFSYEKVKK